MSKSRSSAEVRVVLHIVAEPDVAVTIRPDMPIVRVFVIAVAMGSERLASHDDHH